jgi:hypothetical protein
MFSDCAEAICNIQRVFGMMYPANSMEEWVPTLTTDGYPTVDFSTKYFTRSRSAGTIDFDPLIDPKGLLASAATGIYRHTSDNVVSYHERMTDDEGDV